MRCCCMLVFTLINNIVFIWNLFVNAFIEGKIGKSTI